MAICETCDYSNRPPYKSPCSECDKTMGSPFCCYEHEEKPTNADRIRAMSDEELACFLCSVYDEDQGITDEHCSKFIYGYVIPDYDEDKICEWLKHPAE